MLQIKSKVLEEDSQASLILFGSKARGDHKIDSDWDLLVLTSKQRTVELERKLRNSIYEIELEHLQPVSAIIP
ncbi:MAG: nucleotidyltransferase domain-containing protein [Bacteroidota bacterium]